MRYVVREQDPGRYPDQQVWGVYDTLKPSWPAIVDGRRIANYTTDKAKAEADATWLNEREAKR